jgi:transcriptional regulator with XRE-family HTH domain
METDETLGRNVRALREAAGLSQARLAEQMTDAGLAGFYPQTITKVEQGSRSLRFAEGLQLARLLGVAPQALYDQSATSTAVDEQVAQRAINELRSASHDVKARLRDLEEAEFTLAHLLGGKTLPPGLEASARMALSSSGRQATLASLEPADLEEDQREPTDSQNID